MGGHRYIRIADEVASSTFGIPADSKRVVAKFFFAGDCEPTLAHDPTSIDGRLVTFFWDVNARSLLAGWWIIKLEVDGCPCGEYPTRIENGCVSTYEGSDDYEDCQDCDGLPKARKGCKSVVMKREKCVRPICPPGVTTRPAKYTPDYEVP